MKKVMLKSGTVIFGKETDPNVTVGWHLVEMQKSKKSKKSKNVLRMVYVSCGVI